MTDDPLEGAQRLGFASSRTDASERWSELSIFRTAEGYAAHRVGRSTIAGERDLPTTFRAGDPRELVQMLSRPGRGGRRVPQLAATAIAAAAAADAAFAAGLTDELSVEQYGDATPAAGSLVVELQRDDEARSVRFCGRPIAHGAAPGDRGSAITIFAVDDGTFAVAIVGDDRRDDAAVRARAHVGVDALAIANALQFRDGWTRVARRTLHAAAIADPRFGAGVRDLLDAGLPLPATILRNGSAYVRFIGARIAALTEPIGGGGTRTIAAFRRVDDVPGYVVGEIVRHAGARQGRVLLYGTADAFVAAFRGDRRALVDAAAQHDPDVAAVLRRHAPVAL